MANVQNKALSYQKEMGWEGAAEMFLHRVLAKHVQYYLIYYYYYFIEV